MTMAQSQPNIAELTDPFSLSKVVERATARTRNVAAKVLRLVRPEIAKSTYLPPVFNVEIEPVAAPRKRALLNYLVKPFHLGQESADRHSYSNESIARMMARSLNRNGYVVDVVDWLDTTFQPACDYDLFIGMTPSFQRLANLLKPDTIKIYWATRSHASFEKAALQARLDALYKRRGLSLREDELFAGIRDDGVESADAIFVIGNQQTVSTYDHLGLPTYAVTNACLPIKKPELDAKDFATARKNFLFLSSWGLVHKGLDQTLDAFSKMPDLHLWICAPLKDDRAFLRAYRTELFDRSNIHPIGWVDLHSEKFRHLVNRCAFQLFPSCAEGMAGSVLNGMSQGLIPLITRESGIDLASNSYLDPCSPELIGKVATEVSNWPSEKVRNEAILTIKEAETAHSFDAVLSQFESALRAAIGMSQT